MQDWTYIRAILAVGLPGTFYIWRIDLSLVNLYDSIVNTFLQMKALQNPILQITELQPYLKPVDKDPVPVQNADPVVKKTLPITIYSKIDLFNLKSSIQT